MQLGQEKEFCATQENTISALTVLIYCQIYGYKVEKLELLFHLIFCACPVEEGE